MKFLDKEIFGVKLHVMSKGKTVKKYPRYVGKTLDRVMRLRHEVLFVGTAEGSSFIFIGTPKEYFKTQAKRRVRGGKMTKPAPLTEYIDTRKVVEMYNRICGDGVVVIVEGKEKGVYWDKSEYDADVTDILTLPYIDGEYNGLHKTKIGASAVAETKRYAEPH